ncbi:MULTISPECIES: glycoside hydrolase family 16 protein [unclassified Mucilaginibacter]|uniref:glycoside hydrolase family 16 protein n=1 Tax=unclassified Mucilaginibacter TaxID=2617802 RepID=UPI002AC9EB20|nr:MULTISPECIES: glycoside hydrolase family 16 protein [unclassified Mucilaginibacter]MEB0260330.1 glycoside hydrolase family 16 protein [Mucilaginibacter sp. 10I4]MEB0279369.1 glycoside hydrolase family 16 protein [Mucilaginibacter sp. 10B2]MEB0300496.1 glycoside hydrolase family 16 protein [Mucilaginibacter sp. 5C4]WPX21742.1 glycoside hydrolase family 16 protein [Mucilaginibacter sp. 5C4]
MKRKFVLAVALLVIAVYNNANAQGQTIKWSGYTWNVKEPTEATGPGPNYWSGNNVWVDGSGWLHLKISKNATNGRWECAEVASTESFGMGTYQWQIDADVDKFDKNLVLGLFDYSGTDARDEIDIEFARWGNSAYPNLNYTVYPKAGDPPRHTSYSTEFTSPNGTYTTHRFIRTANSVTFKTLYGHLNEEQRDNLFLSKEFKSPSVSVSSVAMPVLLNLWLFKGQAPTDDKPFEVVIHSFKFTAQ